MSLFTSAPINLHTIFRYLIDNDNFLLSIEEVNEKLPSTKKKQKVNVMTNMITDYSPLSPYEIQEYQNLPSKLKTFLNPKYSRLGIKNVTEKNLNIINISFLNSLNIILRPELFRMNVDDQMKNVLLLESFLVHKISRNYQVDKAKNTSRVKTKNRALIELLSQGKITNELIQCIVNIFEINLVIFDFTKSEILMYWTGGTKYPYFNFFREIYFMSHVQNNYEPIITLDNTLDKEEIHKIYTNILINADQIKFNTDFRLSVVSLPYIETWNISDIKYLKILEKFYNKTTKTLDQCIKEFNTLIELLEEGIKGINLESNQSDDDSD